MSIVLDLQPIPSFGTLSPVSGTGSLSSGGILKERVHDLSDPPNVYGDVSGLALGSSVWQGGILAGKYAYRYDFEFTNAEDASGDAVPSLTFTLSFPSSTAPVAVYQGWGAPGIATLPVVTWMPGSLAITISGDAYRNSERQVVYVVSTLAPNLTPVSVTVQNTSPFVDFGATPLIAYAPQAP